MLISDAAPRRESTRVVSRCEERSLSSNSRASFPELLSELIFLKGVDGLSGRVCAEKTTVFEPNDIVDSSEKFLETEEPITRSPGVARQAFLWTSAAVFCAICLLFFATSDTSLDSVDQTRSFEGLASTPPPPSESAQYDKLEPISPAAAGTPHAIASGQARSDPTVGDHQPTQTSQVHPSPSRERVKVASATKIRSGPSASAAIIGIAHAGAEAEVAARDAEWVQITDPAFSKTGWIHSKFLVPATVATPATSPLTGEGIKTGSPQVDASVGSPDENATLPTEPESSVKSKKPRKHGWRNRHRRGLVIRFNLRRLW